MNAILFSDTGFQKTGWGKQLHDQERVIQEYFEQAEHILATSTTRLAFNATVSEMNALPESYALAYLLQASYAGYLKKHGVSIERFAGIGIGAYAAGYAAGAYTFADGLYLVSKWTTLYRDHLLENSLRKLSISGISHKKIKTVLPSTVYFSEIIAPDVCTVAGKTAEIELLQQTLVEAYPHAQMVLLDVELGIYGGIDEVCQVYKQYLEKVEFNDITAPLISSIDHVSALTQAADLKAYFGDLPCSTQYVGAVLEQFADIDTLFLPYAGQPLLEWVQARYPDKRIDIVPG